MPLQATSGAASYDAFGGGVPVVPNYIEDVFSTWLYTGTGATATITNGIDLSTKGGLVWIKSRSNATDNSLFSTNIGVNKWVTTNGVSGIATTTDSLTSFNTNGFTLGSDATFGTVNVNTRTYTSWTFRKQAKFYDVLNYTGNGANRTISHSLGSIPGCIMIRRTDGSGAAWQVYHRSLANTEYIVLNTTAAKATGATRWNSTTPTSTVFSLGTDATVNASGGTYVAYVFAHEAGGFGLTGTDNVISCGSFTTDGSGNATVSLGYEPQWTMFKASSTTGNWFMLNNIAGWANAGANGTAQRLYANTAAAEVTDGVGWPTATGFQAQALVAGETYIYIAIRRGPMKVPTTGTSVFGLNARTGSNVNVTVTGGQTDDAVLIKARDSSFGSVFASRLTGTNYLETSSTAAQVAAGVTILQANPWDVMDGVKVGTNSSLTNSSPTTYINYLFKRAPSFMDVVCYTGTGANLTLSHNLQAAPELIITKKRSAVNEWYVTHSFTASGYKRQYLEQTAAASSHLYSDNFVFTAQPTTTSLFYGSNSNVNQSGQTFVNYLFATCAGVSKVGSYTGTATTKQIDCGFTGGARFVLIKRTDSTGDWYVWDSARGIVSGNDPYLLLNSTAAEVTNTDYVDTYSAGFEISSTAPAAINASGGSFIFFAVA